MICEEKNSRNKVLGRAMTLMSALFIFSRTPHSVRECIKNMEKNAIMIG